MFEVDLKNRSLWMMCFLFIAITSIIIPIVLIIVDFIDFATIDTVSGKNKPGETPSSGDIPGGANSPLPLDPNAPDNTSQSLPRKKLTKQTIILLIIASVTIFFLLLSVLTRYRKKINTNKFDAPATPHITPDALVEEIENLHQQIVVRESDPIDAPKNKQSTLLDLVWGPLKINPRFLIPSLYRVFGTGGKNMLLTISPDFKSFFYDANNGLLSANEILERVKNHLGKKLENTTESRLMKVIKDAHNEMPKEQQTSYIVPSFIEGIIAGFVAVSLVVYHFMPDETKRPRHKQFLDETILKSLDFDSFLNSTKINLDDVRKEEEKIDERYNEEYPDNPIGDQRLEEVIKLYETKGHTSFETIALVLYGPGSLTHLTKTPVTREFIAAVLSRAPLMVPRLVRIRGLSNRQEVLAILETMGGAIESVRRSKIANRKTTKEALQGFNTILKSPWEKYTAYHLNNWRPFSELYTPRKDGLSASKSLNEYLQANGQSADYVDKIARKTAEDYRVIKFIKNGVEEFRGWRMTSDQDIYKKIKGEPSNIKPRSKHFDGFKVPLNFFGYEFNLTMAPNLTGILPDETAYRDLPVQTQELHESYYASYLALITVMTSTFFFMRRFRRGRRPVNEQVNEAVEETGTALALYNPEGPAE